MAWEWVAAGATVGAPGGAPARSTSSAGPTAQLWSQELLGGEPPARTLGSPGPQSPHRAAQKRENQEPEQPTKSLEASGLGAAVGADSMPAERVATTSQTSFSQGWAIYFRAITPAEWRGATGVNAGVLIPPRTSLDCQWDWGLGTVLPGYRAGASATPCPAEPPSNCLLTGL